jgi:hypothetical protein
MIHRMRPNRTGQLGEIGLLCGVSLSLWQLPACSSDGDGSTGPTNTGQSCNAVDQCYPGVKAGDLLGEAVCLDRIEGGYCSHHCVQDSDCCAAAGECDGAHTEVCGPFESMGELYCFLSCEDEDFSGTPIGDADVYCQTYAGAAFHCRSTGGGSNNRKVCTP